MEAGGDDFAPVPRETMLALAGPDPTLCVEALHAGYGSMEVLHGIDLCVGAGQSVCVVGPNGAGKSTALNAVFGLCDVSAGRVLAGGIDITRASPGERFRNHGIAYMLQDSSIFPDLSVEENLWLGGHLLPGQSDARAAAERIFERYPRLADRRRQPAGVLSGGERRLLEISRSLVMEPRILLVDEPSIGLEPRYVRMVFDLLAELQHRDRKTIVVVEQNVRKGLEFADIGLVMVSGKVVMANSARQLLEDPRVGELFLGGGRVAEPIAC